jgi:SOS-response transcriptional repressor LexA
VSDVIPRRVPASWIAAALSASGVSGNELGRRMDVTSTTVSRWNTGMQPVTDDKWRAILVALPELPTDWRPPETAASAAHERASPSALDSGKPATVPPTVKLTGRMNVGERGHVLVPAPQLWLPLYTLKAAAGGFSPPHEPEPEAMLCLDGMRGPIDDKLFVSHVHGRSMMPVLRDNDLVVWRRGEGWSSGDIVLAQLVGIDDPETGGAFTVKRIVDGETVRPRRILLQPLNTGYLPIVVPAEHADRVRVIARLVAVVDQG